MIVMKKVSFIAAVCALSCALSASAYTGASDWAAAELKKAEEYSLIPPSLESADVSKPITRSEFASLSVKLYEALGKTELKAAETNPFSDTADAEVLKAYAAGITTGTSDTTFEPDALLSREQAATMLARTYSKSMDKEAKPSGTAEKFADDDFISDWAKDSVYFMAENGIINGIGEGKFAPQNVTKEQEDALYANSTREQAVAISVRMYEKFKTDDAKDEPKEDITKQIPAYSFGEPTDKKITDTRAELSFENVDGDAIAEYIKTAKPFFPEVTYELNEGYQKALKASNDEYSIFISWSQNGKASIIFEKIQ